MKDLQSHQSSAFKPHELCLCVYFWGGLGWVGLADGVLDAKKKPNGKRQESLTQLL